MAEPSFEAGHLKRAVEYCEKSKRSLVQERAEYFAQGTTGPAEYVTDINIASQGVDTLQILPGEEGLARETAGTAEYVTGIKTEALHVASQAVDTLETEILPGELSSAPGDISEAVAQDLEDISRCAADMAEYADALRGDNDTDAAVKILDEIFEINQKATPKYTTSATLRASKLIPGFIGRIGAQLAKCFIIKLVHGQFPLLWGLYQILNSNPATRLTIQYLWTHMFELIVFMVELFEPLKGFPPSSSVNGNPGQAGAGLNQYNELDMEVPMNRHAMICQFQRLARSAANILSAGQNQNHLGQLDFADFVMDTRLETDDDEKIESSEQGQASVSLETWIFINGIAGEPYWLRLACNKLGDKFQRKVQGIFNGSDGFFWDLLECASERSSGDATLIKRTKSSEIAQKKVEETLRVQLKEPVDDEHKVVLIAHSQGCLLLRLGLEELGKDEHIRKRMLNRLCVFTFGNPSLDWTVSRYCHRTEHFANRKDFVA
ncbi:hypothetical protein BJX96DRAFT_99415 [Aspergillus floccosus]